MRARKANIEQDDSRQFTLDEPAQCRPAVDAGHTEIVFAKVLDQQMALGGLVFDHDDMRPAIHHSDLAWRARDTRITDLLRFDKIPFRSSATVH